MAMPFKLHSPSMSPAHAGEQGGMFQMLRDTWLACRRSWAAADHYEALKSMSDQALAERGIQRKDLARVAFDRLSQDD